MATYSKAALSGSTNGRAIKIAATATPGTLVHTGSVDPAVYHEVWLYAINTDTADHKLTVEWGGTTAPDDLIEVTVPTEGGLMLIAPGLILVGNATPLIVRAFADTLDVVTVHGFINAAA